MSPAPTENLDPASVQPMDVDGVAASIVGTIAFAVAFLAMLPFRHNLQATNGEHWLWTALAGAVIGALLIGYTVRRRSVYRAARARGDEG